MCHEDRKSGETRTRSAKRTTKSAGNDLIVKTGVRAGGVKLNHNEKLASEKSKTLRVKTSVKAGLLPAV